jgi:hypothetical protein
MRSKHRSKIEVLNRHKVKIKPVKKYWRPQTRADCSKIERPCPYVGCRHNLYLSVTKAGNIKFHHPDIEPHELKCSCALDLADDGDMLLEEIGDAMQLTRERVRQIEGMAFEKIRNDPHFSAVLGEYLEDVA